MICTVGFKARVDPLNAFSPVWSSDSALVQHLLPSSARPSQSMYFQIMYPQVLMGFKPMTMHARTQCCKPFSHCGSVLNSGSSRSCHLKTTTSSLTFPHTTAQRCKNYADTLQNFQLHMSLSLFIWKGKTQYFGIEIYLQQSSCYLKLLEKKGICGGKIHYLFHTENKMLKWHERSWPFEET